MAPTGDGGNISLLHNIFFTNIVLLATFALSTALIIYSIVKKAVPFGDEVDIKVFKNPLLAFVIITIYVLLMALPCIKSLQKSLNIF